MRRRLLLLEDAHSQLVYTLQHRVRALVSRAAGCAFRQHRLADTGAWAALSVNGGGGRNGGAPRDVAGRV